MFSPPQRKFIAIAALLGLGLCLPSSSEGQDSEFQRRLSAMRQARSRATQVNSGSTVATTNQPNTLTVATHQPMVATQASGSANGNVQPATAQLPAGTLVSAQSPPPSMPQTARRRFVPSHVRTAQAIESPGLMSGAPIVNSTPMQTSIVPGTVMGGETMGSTIVDGQVVAQPYVDGTAAGACLDDCGSCGGFFDDCCGRGGCPDCQDCWINRLGFVFKNTEFYSGFTSFRSTLFTNPTTASNDLFDDSSFGYYGGFNFGIPLCRLTCGALSGQFGVRTVNTNFNGNAISADDRNQLFLTAGLFRRNDYGLQFGVVADVLREEWYANTDLVQIRGDVGYVWPAGTTFGFKFATNVQDDTVSGTFGGVAFTNQIVTTNDNYRFYVRHDAKAGGWGEIFAGWSDSNQGIIGLDFDMPITNRVALEAGFTYFLNDDGVPANAGFIGGQQGQAFNTYVGVAFRPSGRRFYRNYDRPMFDVADNGSMLTIR